MPDYTFNKTIVITADEFKKAILQFKKTFPTVLIESITGETINTNEELINNINDELYVNPLFLKGIMNKNNSCFLDSVLVPLLIVESPIKKAFLTGNYTQECIKNVQNSFKELLKMAQKKATSCSTVATKLKECNQTLNKMLTGGQEDDSEFLIQLMDLFKLECTKIKTIHKYSNDKENWITRPEITESFVILEVTNWDSNENLLDVYQKGVLQDFPEENERPLKDEPEGGQRYKYTRVIIDSSDCLIFHTQRKLFDRKIKTPISFSKYIKNTENGSIYKLAIITVHSGGHSGGHYVAYFNFEGDWYFYDDLEPNIILVDWEKVVKQVKSDSSLFFYFPY